MMIAIINPFRYRSYYYDRETNLYYLNSRYYNPEWGRFINADGIINGNTDIIGHNLYAYCSNNPVGNMDSEGIFFRKIILVVSKAYKMIKTAIAATSNIYLRTKKQDLSADMFTKAMYYPKLPMTNYMKNKISNKAKESDEVASAIRDCIIKNEDRNFTNCKTSPEFISGDLHYSIGKADLEISGEKTADYWNVEVRLSDKYDFDDPRKFKTISDAANYLGFYMQETYMLGTYYWDVNFSVKYMNGGGRF